MVSNVPVFLSVLLPSIALTEDLKIFQKLVFIPRIKSLMNYIFFPRMQKYILFEVLEFVNFSEFDEFVEK